MERLLQYVWQHRIFPLRQLLTTDGAVVEVIDPGFRNTDSGPDFFNAKMRIGDTMWAGNVEVHERSSQWYEHGHDKDSAYDNVVLHVVTTVDAEVRNQRGDVIPQVQLAVPEQVELNFKALEEAEQNPPCHEVVRGLSKLVIHSWMSMLQTERLENKSKHIMEMLHSTEGDWEQTYFNTLAHNFGFGINGDAFDAWTEHLPLRAAAKHRDNAFQIEALFLGQAGLLDVQSVPNMMREQAAADPYFLKLQHEYLYLAHKFELQPMDYKLWRFLRLRPQNFPYIRIVQLANLYCGEQARFSNVRDAGSVKDIYKIFDTKVSEYWETHYVFGSKSEPNRKKLTQSSINLIIINTVTPILFAYGRYCSEERYVTRSGLFLEQLKPEVNHITRAWEECGIELQSAADSQALIELQRNYCDKKDCLRCRFGYEFLKSGAWPVVREKD
jgi:hypothetical protein